MMQHHVVFWTKENRTVFMKSTTGKRGINTRKRSFICIHGRKRLQLEALVTITSINKQQGMHGKNFSSIWIRRLYFPYGKAEMLLYNTYGKQMVQSAALVIKLDSMSTI